MEEDKSGKRSLSKTFIKESFEYLRSDEAIKINRDNLLNQIVEYLNNKYPTSKVSFENSNDNITFSINGSDEDKLKILDKLQQYTNKIKTPLKYI